MNGAFAGLLREARKALLVCGKDLRIEWKSPDNLPAMFFFGLLVLVIFNFGFEAITPSFVDVGPGMLWVAFSFSGVLTFAHAFAVEREGDALQGLLVAPIDAGTLYIGKMIACFLSMTLVELAILPLSALLFDFNIVPVAGSLAVVVPIHTLGYAAVGTLFSAMAARTRRGDVLLPILLFSLSVPLMISAVRCTQAALAGGAIFTGPAGAWMAMACAFDVIFLAAATLTFEYVVED